MSVTQLVEKTYKSLSEIEKEEVLSNIVSDSSLYKLKKYVSEQFNIEFDDDGLYREFIILFLIKLVEWKDDLKNILSLQEASIIWGLNDSTLRKAIASGKFREYEYRKTGRNYIIKRSAIERVYGCK